MGREETEGREGEGEQSSVGALTGRGADRPRRGRVIEMCFYSGGEKKREKSCREKKRRRRRETGKLLQKLNEQASPEK